MHGAIFLLTTATIGANGQKREMPHLPPTKAGRRPRVISLAVELFLMLEGGDAFACL